jgi:conserved oligomeric Golgi complex subunit 7
MATQTHSSSNTDVDSLGPKLAAILRSPTFSVAEYLNTALEVPLSKGPLDPAQQNELQQSMAELALQLQLQTQTCHEDIGRVGAELQAVLPRCAADLSRVSTSLTGLQMDCTALLHSTAALSTNNSSVSSSLETLSTLHALQANLTRTKEILMAAAMWDETLQSVTAFIAQQNLPEAVHCLAELEKGERALRGMPHPQERVQALSRARQQVGTLLQPQLKNALAVLSTRAAPLQQCVALYSQLDQMETLIHDYVKHRPTLLHKQWFEYVPPVPGQDASSTTFASWLPGWFDAVLQLVSEERRQSTSIFGTALVPEITIQVFRECFRPILPSLTSRLSSIYSSDPLGPKKGSLTEISSIYESMLQFLSLAYETIVGGWLDMAESSREAAAAAAAGNNIHNPKHFQDLMDVFVLIASPFVDYQRNLPKLESKFLGEQTQALAKDMQQATTSVAGTGVNLSVVQAAADRLQDLSITVFPLTESAIARFELLNGGFAATNVLAVVDRLLAGHAGELAIAVHKLSAAMNSDEKALVDNFDEQHVLCALQVLKVAGRFVRSLRFMETKTFDRLAVLWKRATAHTAKAKTLHEALERMKNGERTSFQLADSMSVVEIDSLLTQAACVDEVDFDASFAALQRLVNREESVVTLYRDAQESARRLVNSCHTFVHDVCVSVPRFHLSGMASLPAWNESSQVDDFASYGTLPQEYITHVGEHVLALVQALEPFATDKEALSLANEVMDGVRQVAQQSWLDFISASGSVPTESAALTLMDGKALVPHVLGVSSLEGDEDDDDAEEENENEDSKAITVFCNAWLDVVGLAVTGRLLERIMCIPLLTNNKGCDQLRADLSYIINVLSALGVSGHPHVLLSHIAELSSVEVGILFERIDSLDRTDATTALLIAIEQRFAATRNSY